MLSLVCFPTWEEGSLLREEDGAEEVQCLSGTPSCREGGLCCGHFPSRPSLCSAPDTLCCPASLCYHTVTLHLLLFQMGEVLPLGLRLGEQSEMGEF